jgi:acetaldehyde dehydrogenase (acetylating)
VTQLDPDLRSLQEVRDALARAKAAAHAVREYSQSQIDRVCEAMARAVEESAYPLARAAVEETGIGRVHYKILKNLFGSRGTWESIKDEKTVGVVRRDEARGILEVATPSGVIAGIVPTTNPTSTAAFKALVSVKGRNACVLSPHPRAIRCIGETVEVMRRAIRSVGAPPDLVVALQHPTLESTGALMRSEHTAIILATGGEGLVHAAYSSGRPAYGVGPGNVPVYIDRSADIAGCARDVVTSQSFDNATFCCSEQALVIDRPVYESLMRELVARGAHVCDERETALLAAHCNRGGMMNPSVVGQDPWKVARAAGFEVPESTTVLLCHQGGVGKDWPLTIEILCPLLSVHVVDGWREGCDVSMQTLKHGGLGHTLGVHATDPAVLDAFFLEKPASRIIVNGPTSQGAVGYSTNLDPSVSLGCGPQAGNISSDNITARHLLNIKRVAYRKRDWREQEARDHALAASLGGESAPRGSLLDGDPALAGTRRASSVAEAVTSSTNWQGNPAVGAPRERAAGAAPAPRPSVAPAPAPAPTPAPRPAPAPPASRPAPQPLVSKVGPGAKSAPTFTGGAVARTRPAAAPSGAPRAAAAAAPRPLLSQQDIETILSHAGTGCPLGPCKGCPHLEVTTGVCQA